MALTAPLVRILRELQPLLPRGGSLLEIGEANWYGDIEPDFPCDTSDGFAICKAMYADTFAPSRIVSIDYNGTPEALRLDLNNKLPYTNCRGGYVRGKFDLIINHGTAEHIFNIAQVFRTMHDHCVDAGLMIHDAPFTGWIDHGFYTLQPTLFYDLAAANNYEVVRVYVTEIKSNTVIRLESRDHVAALAQAGKIPNNSCLVVALRKLGERPFNLPLQGYYGGQLSEAGRKAWETR